MLVANLPPGSAVWAAESGLPPGMTPTDYLLADVFHALAGEPHPLRQTRAAEPGDAPRPARSQHEELAAKLRAQRARLRPTPPKEAPPNE